jgi:hypothetical protein
MNTDRSADEVRSFFAKRSWLRDGSNSAILSFAEYLMLHAGKSLQPKRMRDLSCFISGYLKAKE